VLATEAQETTVTPDEHLLSGGQVLGIGLSGSRHSFLLPSLRVSETLDSNPLLLSTNNGSYRGFADFGGSLRWIQYFGRDAGLSYSGAVRYDSRARVQGYDQFTNAHSAAIDRIIRFNSWNLLVVDAVQYSQGSSFGASGMEGMGLVSVPTNLSGMQWSPTTLRSDLTPSQSILIGRVGTVANTALLELDVRLNARDSISLETSYGLLHFNSSLFTDTYKLSAIGGYNRRLTSRDSIALEGAYSRITYQQPDTTIDTEYFSALYARRITGRSSMELGGGPEITQERVSGVDKQYPGWQARGTVRYQLSRLSLSATGERAVTSGAGVLEGATSSTGRGTVSFAIERSWTTSLAAGVSRNQELTSAQRYDMQFASIVLNHKIGRYAGLFLSYDFQHQTTGSVCTGPACGYTGLRNVFGIGFAWDYRPIGIE
jgi:hypothetical protein